ncbi:3-ketoacyl-CoA synthase 20-like isoform X2 [Castanea sativa]|uniref:3-ketoacyl-CoA synthase 20-like isoform X2 n=1 Tax=Castanea sativa TaxID=21020 RepID=UPI003F651850
MGNENNQNQDKEPNSTKLKYVKLGFHYLISNALYLFLVPLTMALSHLSVEDFIHLFHHIKLNLVVVILCTMLAFFLATFYFMSRPKQVYLLDFACYKPDSSLICKRETFIKKTRLVGVFTEESLAFQKKILERSGYGEKTYVCKALLDLPVRNLCLEEARKEAEMVIFGAVDQLLAKTGVKSKDIGILVLNCSLLNPTPSLSAMVVNRYKLRGNISCYNLSGMGCSAGLVSIDLAKRLLQIRPNSYALVVSMESLTLAGYDGNTRSMLIPNCLFRMGAAAILLTNRSSDRHCSKYQLVHALRTHKGADDRGYNCVFQKEDINNRLGVALSKDLLPVAGEGGRAVLDELEKSLGLSEWHMEPSRMTLYRFGNTSSSSLWYELAYTEAKGRIKKGDRAWQIAFGSGFKCNSVVWRALRTINSANEKHNPWIDEIDSFPVHVPEVAPIDC